MSKTVIFDVGQVLIHWDVFILYRKLLPDDEAVAAFIDEVDLFSHNLEFDRGVPMQERLALLADEFPHRKPLLEVFETRWQETVPGAVEGSVEILSELKASAVPLYAITNFARENWHPTTERFAFLNDTFVDIVVSAHEGIIKPDPAIYNLLLQRNQLSAEECVFIDDSERNVAGAAAVGIDAIHFKDPEQLRQDLRQRGLPLKPTGTRA